MDEHVQKIFDDGIFAFSQNDYEDAISNFEKILASEPNHFDALQSLGMAYYRMGNYPKAIEIGHLAEKQKPDEQSVHTNLSLFYMKNGEKLKAEHHGLQARIAAWKKPDSEKNTDTSDSSEELKMAETKPENIVIPKKFPDMPWKNDD